MILKELVLKSLNLTRVEVCFSQSVEWTKNASAVKICCCSHVPSLLCRSPPPKPSDSTCKLNFFLFSKIEELFAKLLQKNREFAQFFLAVALKKTAFTTAQLLQFVAHSSITCDPVYLSNKIKQTPGYRLRETEDWGEFNLSWQLLKYSTEKFSFFAQHFGGNIRVFVATPGGVLDISLSREVRRGPSYPDPV